MRWLSGSAKELKDWSLVSADRVLELAEAAFVAVAADLRCSGPGQLLQIWTTSAATAC